MNGVRDWKDSGRKGLVTPSLLQMASLTVSSLASPHSLVWNTSEEHTNITTSPPPIVLHTRYLSLFLHAHILSHENFTLGKCVNLQQNCQKQYFSGSSGIFLHSAKNFTRTAFTAFMTNIRYDLSSIEYDLFKRIIVINRMLQFKIQLDLPITDSLIKLLFFWMALATEEEEKKLVIATDYEGEGLEGGISIICP